MCVSPVILKSGLAVPCGKCDICKSQRRNEWSTRIAINLRFYDRMPMFITLTYDDKHLPYVCQCDLESKGRIFTLENDEFRNRCLHHSPTLYRSDVSAFLKEYKRVHGLHGDDFTYFGCGEYGDQFGRPHYHLIFCGDDELYNLYFQDEKKAFERISKIWNKGHVHVGVAGYDGIHYVTKYCLKEGLAELPEECVKPFTISSNNLGAKWFDTAECAVMRAKIQRLYDCYEELCEAVAEFPLDSLSGVHRAIDFLETYYVPKLTTILDNGEVVPLPRYFRKRLIGSFEYFKNNPFWLHRHLCLLRDSMQYYYDFGDYDKEHDVNMSMQQCLTRLEKIKKRLLKKKHDKNVKK